VPRLDDRPGEERGSGTGWLAVLLVSAALGATVVGLAVTRHHQAYFNDTAIYLGTASNIVHGKGVTSPISMPFTDSFAPAAAAAFDGGLPITTHAPLYPIAIAAVAWLGPGLDTAARVVGAVSLGAMTAVTGAVAWVLTRSRVLVLVAIVLLLAGGPVVQDFTPASWMLLSGTVLAEALFFALTLAGCLFAARALTRGSAASAVVAGALIAASVLTRFLGLALLVVVVVAALVRPGWVWSQRRRTALVVLVVGAGPFVLWRVLLAALVGRGRGLPLAYHAMTMKQWRFAWPHFTHWFVPLSVPSWAATLVFLVIVGGTVAMAACSRGEPTGRPARLRADAPGDEAGWLLVVLGGFVVAYLAAVFVTHSLLIRGTGFDPRFLAVVRPIVYLVVLGVAYRFLCRFGPQRAVLGVAAAALVVVAPFVPDAVRLVDHGIPVRTTNDALAHAVQRLPRSALIVSNGPDAVWIATQRPSVLVPIHVYPTSGTTNTRFASNVREVRSLMRVRDAYLVMYTPGAPGLATVSDVGDGLLLRTVATARNGAIYRAASR